MQIDLWHFDEFKGGDTLILSGRPDAIEALADRLEALAFSAAIGFALEDCFQVVGFGKLVVLKGLVPVTGRFRWLISVSELNMMAAKVRAISTSAPAHQYFDLVEAETTLLITAGEYASEWFSAQAGSSTMPR